MSILSATFLVLAGYGRLPTIRIWSWWALMISTLALRGIDILYLHRARIQSAWDGRAEVWRFASGLIVTAILWAAFPLFFFDGLSETGRTSTAIVLSAMAGGSVTVLAASRWLAFIYCAALLLPVSTLFLLSSGFEHRSLGVLGWIFFAVMVMSTRVAHRAAMDAMQLNRELKSAQSALGEVNHSLESTVRERTAELQREVQERERYALELVQLASIDGLTGLHNRSELAKRLEKTLSEAGTNQSAVAVLFIDLDKFKEVNDVMGHITGDQVLVAVARCLTRCLPPGTDLARWGGDEFVAVLTGIDSDAMAVKTADCLCASLTNPIPVDMARVKIDATIGIAIFPQHGTNHDELIRASDIAMFAGKEANSRIRVFDPVLAERLMERHRLEQALGDALVTGALTLVFQPVIAASNGHCDSMEALLRWRHPERGPISPAEFIPLAERSGLIVEIGRWVLQEACRQAAMWTGEPPPAVSVNVSLAQILSGSLLADVQEALSTCGIAPTRLHLEITESLFSGNHQLVQSVLTDLRKLGIRISLDDFGTGFSCLAYLRTLPIDRIKIDRSFVRAVEGGTKPIVQAILTLAWAQGHEVVAEGVETQEQRAILTSMGVDFLQGFLYGHPFDAEAARGWLEERVPGKGISATAFG